MSTTGHTDPNCAGPRPDRRVAKTRSSLVAALTTLILERGYRRLTVQDILDGANVGRSTFYAHFRDKDELLLGSFEWLFSSLEAEAPSTGTSAGFPALEFMRHAADHRLLHRALARDGTLVALVPRLQGLLVRRDLARRGLNPHSPEPAERALAEMRAGAFLALVTWWLESGASLPPEEVYKLLLDQSGQPALAL
ncbi:MAG: TetR/AcrR family transcriptional regulator [Dehalococcoidia bacterium]